MKNEPKTQAMYNVATELTKFCPAVFFNTLLVSSDLNKGFCGQKMIFEIIAYIFDSVFTKCYISKATSFMPRFDLAVSKQ